jgi:hypothetical protein
MPTSSMSSRPPPAEEDPDKPAPTDEAAPVEEQPSMESTLPFGADPDAEPDDSPFQEEDTEDLGNPFSFGE